MWKVYDKNNLEKYAIRKLEYFGGFMDRKYVTTTIKSSKPVDFQIGDFFTYRGERFTLNYIPSVSKKSTVNSTGDAFVYENIIFNSYSDELIRCEFLDYVLHDNIIHFSSLPTFGFYAASAQDLADRVQANLDRIYTGSNKWSVSVHHDFISPVGVFISIDKSNVWDSLSLFKTKFNANFIIRGRNITIGTAGQVIDNVFEYGKDKGLVKIEKISQSDQQIITRLRVYGSTRNIPHRYYNKLSNASLENYLPDNMAVHNLMLPSFPYETLDPFLDSENISELGIMEGSVFFDGSNELLPEIYPSMEGMTAQQLNNAGITVNLYPGDNGNLDEIVAKSTNMDGTPIEDNGVFEEGEDIPSFKIAIKDVLGNSGNLADIIVDGASISFKSGMCAGREFEIIGCEKDGLRYVLTCNRVEDSGVGLFFPYKDYPIELEDKFVLLNIEMPEVYIKSASQRLFEAGKEYLSKNDYVRYAYQVKISPVLMARNPSLGDAIIEGDYLMFTDEDLGIDGSIIIDTLRIKEGEEVIPSYEITLTDEKQVGAIKKLQNQIDMIISGGHGGFSEEQVKSLVNLYGSRLFLSKLNPDTAKEVITFLKGIIANGTSHFADLIASGKITAENIDINDTLKTSILHSLVRAELKDVILKGQLNSEVFISGLLGSGFRLTQIGNDWVLELDRLIIRKAMEVYEIIVQKIKYQGGQVLHSPAGGKITKVTDGGSYWKIEHDSTDSFTTGAQVLCQNFKVGSEMENPNGETTFRGVSEKRYWGLVTSFGKGWFNLSKTDMEAGSAEPEIGDDIAVLGHRTDVNQQGAIMIASTGGNTPYIAYYSGINSFSLAGKEVVREGNLSGIVDDVFGQLSGYGLYGKNVFLRGRLAIQSGKLVEDAIAEVEQSALQAASEAEHKAQQALEDLAAAVSDFENEIEGIQQQMDGMVNSWFFPYSPTLSNYPASEWVTDSLKDAHVGDTFTNTQEYIDDITTPDSGKSWRWVKNGGVYSWNRISDSDAAKALMLASQAQATADGKSTVYLVQPSSYSLGDLWVLNADRTINGTAYKQGEILTATQDSSTFVESHWMKRVRYTDDTAVNELEIGGVNLLDNSKLDARKDWSLNNGSYTQFENYNGVNCLKIFGSNAGVYKNTNTKQGDLYAFSIDILPAADGFFKLGFNTSFSSIAIIEGQWQRISIVKAATKDNDVIIAYSTGADVVRIKNIMLEEGNKPSATWRKSVGDIEAEINTAKTEAETAAKTYAAAVAEAARITAEAHADGIVDAEEQARINDVNAKLSAAKAYADAQDNLLKTQQQAYADGVATQAEQAAIAVAQAQANLAKEQAQAYADGKVSAEEQARIADAQAKLTEAKNYAEGLVDDLEIKVGNLINNTTLSGTKDRWTATGLTVVNHEFQGYQVPVLQSAVSTDTQNYSDYFDVDPSKAYEVSMWIKKSAANGRIYVGLNALGGAGVSIGLVDINALNGNILNSNNANFYFWYTDANSSPVDWVQLTGYIMPSGTNPSDMTSVGVFPAGSARRNCIMRPDTKKIRVRWLNWENAGTVRQLWVANPKVQEVDPLAVIKAAQANREVVRVETETKSRFDVNEDKIQANVTEITTVKGSVTGLTTRVTTAEGQLTVQAGQIAAKASQSDVTALGTRVTTAEQTINSHTGQISQKVSITEYDFDKNVISDQFSQIIQRANSIELSVSAVDEKADAIPQKLLATGINIENKKITITANNTIFQNNAGQQVALFNSNFTKIQASAIELEGLVTVNSKFKVLLDGSIETVNMKAVNGEFSGTLVGVTGSFKRLNCVDDDGVAVGSIRFGNNGEIWFENCSIRHQAANGPFYASDVRVRGAFGSYTKIALHIYTGNVARLHYEGINNSSYESITMVQSGMTSGDTYYTIPLYGTTGKASGAPVDLVIISHSLARNYALQYMPGKTVIVVNSNDPGNPKRIYANGRYLELQGGMAATLACINAEHQTPDNANHVGRGWFVVSMHDNTWA